MSAQQVTVEQLAVVPLFSELEDELLGAIAEASTEASFARNETIIREHDLSTSLFVILEGRVKVSLVRQEGREAILAMLGAGDFFGDMSLLDNEPRSASVIAIAPTRVLILTRNDFARLLGSRPAMTVLLLQAITARLRHADQKIADLAFLDAIGRVTNVICELADSDGESTEDGVVIRNRMSHDQLSRMVATTRETVTHCMITLEKRGYVASHGRDLLIHSLDDLRNSFLPLR